MSHECGEPLRDAQCPKKPQPQAKIEDRELRIAARGLERYRPRGEPRRDQPNSTRGLRSTNNNPHTPWRAAFSQFRNQSVSHQDGGEALWRGAAPVPPGPGLPPADDSCAASGLLWLPFGGWDVWPLSLKLCIGSPQKLRCDGHGSRARQNLNPPKLRPGPSLANSCSETMLHQGQLIPIPEITYEAWAFLRSCPAYYFGVRQFRR